MHWGAWGVGYSRHCFRGLIFPRPKKVAGKWLFRKKSGRIIPCDHLQKWPDYDFLGLHVKKKGAGQCSPLIEFEKEVCVKKIHTDSQCADIFTKPLFGENLRKFTGQILWHLPRDHEEGTVLDMD